jgi:glycosyltransferase involved in cell wall biosynthesis
MLKQLMIDKQLENNVYFKGFVPEEELRVVYACADLFLLTSKYEGFGIANVEAMGSGVPVITYDTGAARDFIVDGENGYVTENNPESFSKQVLELLKNRELIIDMKIKARKCVEDELNWDHYADENNKLIVELWKKR